MPFGDVEMNENMELVSFVNFGLALAALYVLAAAASAAFKSRATVHLENLVLRHQFGV
jgi:hypothetical protein